jgi:hypothetical protein
MLDIVANGSNGHIKSSNMIYLPAACLASYHRPADDFEEPEQ